MFCLHFRAHGWLMKRCNSALDRALGTLCWTLVSNFFRFRACRNLIVCRRSRNKSFWMSFRCRWSARRISAFSVVAPAASLSPRDQAGRGAALLCGPVAWPVAGFAGLLRGSQASAPSRQWIGWTEAQRRKRLSLVTNNARFLILPMVTIRIWRRVSWVLTLERLPQDWQGRYGHPVWLAESFVDTQLFRARPTRPAAGTSWVRPRAMAAASRITMSKHDRPRRCLSKNSSPRPGAACARNICRWRWPQWWRARWRPGPPCGSESCVPCASTLPVCRTFAGGGKLSLE